MTQAQWERFTGVNPSEYQNPSHPVESISWRSARTVLARLGLVLPTEAQWEYAARAGTQTPWWTGGEPQSMKGAGNFADVHYAQSFREQTWEMWLDDGAGIHAPVGSYRPNPFGLHDMTGNVYEACEDQVSFAVDPSAPSRLLRSMRGGSYHDLVRFGRSANRDFNYENDADSSQGVRPARTIDPER